MILPNHIDVPTLMAVATALPVATIIAVVANLTASRLARHPNQ
jgi:hypothetical protein